jgi:hypothetical protein
MATNEMKNRRGFSIDAASGLKGKNKMRHTNWQSGHGSASPPA